MAGENQITQVNDVNESYPPSPMQPGMLGHFQSVLKGMAADLSQRVADLPLLGDAEQRQLLAEWNDTATDFPRDKCVHELFETQVERTPNAVALVYNKGEVSYRELDNQAIRVARHLRSLAVGPDVPVGICVQQLDGHGRRSARHFESRRRLRAAGPGLPERAPGLHARRFGSAGPVDAKGFGRPFLPYVSNLTGQWITAREATNPNYWAAHLLQTVRFADGLAELAGGQKGIHLTRSGN